MSSAQAGRVAARLKVQDLAFRYPDRHALQGVNLSLYPGQLLVLLGPNGAGKSTLIRCICGQAKPSDGQVLVNGRAPAEDLSARRSIGLVPQSIALFKPLSVEQNLQIFGGAMGLPRSNIGYRIEQTLASVGLSERKKDRVESLSGGMQRRINIAAALLHEPSLLVLDEPTAGMDNASRQELTQHLKGLLDRGMSILLCTHDLEEAETLASQVAILIGGRIRARGPTKKLVEHLFSDKQIVSIRFADTFSAASAAQALGIDYHTSSSLSLESVRTLASGDLDSILSMCEDIGAAVDEIRARRPGLEHVMQRLTAMLNHAPTRASGRGSK